MEQSSSVDICWTIGVIVEWLLSVDSTDFSCVYPCSVGKTLKA